MVHWGETIAFAWGALALDKVKAALTMVGVTIGSASLVLVVTIVATGRGYIARQITGIGANLAYAELERGGVATIPADELTPSDLATARAVLPMITAAAGTYDVATNIQVGARMHVVALVGVTEEFQEIRRLRITSGRYFDPEDFASRGKVCLVSDKLAHSAFGSEEPLGSTLRLDQLQYTVIGTFREGVPTFGQSEIQDMTVLVPFPLIRIMTGNEYFQVLYVQASDAADVPLMTIELANLLQSRHRGGARYYVQNLSSLLDTARKTSWAMTGVLFAVSVLMLTSAGIGIMNIMLVNVAQRTKEIGIRKAVGATAGEIRLQFLLEAVFISVGGAAVGISAAATLVWVAAGLVEGALPIGLSWISVAVALVLPAAIGVLFGYEPASRAAELHPIEAMRSE